MKVQMSIASFVPSLRIILDGEPVPRISRLSQYQALPFEQWCGSILQAIRDEVNGRFSLEVTGRNCETRIFGQLARQFPDCEGFVSHLPEIGDSALTRIRRLSGFVQSGLACPRFNKIVHIFSSQGEAVADFLPHLPKLSYCRLRWQIHPLDELDNYASSDPAFLILSGREASSVIDEMPRRGLRAAVLINDGLQTPIAVRGTCFIEHVAPERCPAVLESYMELWVYADILREALKSIHIDENHPMYLEVQALDKQEAVTVVRLPRSIELGRTEPIRLSSIPSGASIGNIQYRISDESVIRLDRDGLTAVGTGEAVVEAYIPGQWQKLASQKVTCYRRNRATVVTVTPSSAQIVVGQSLPLTLGFDPPDADDIDRVRLKSTNGLVATVQGQTTVRGRSPGSCSIVAATEQASACCNIEVFDRLEGLSLTVRDNVLRVGEVTPITLKRIPDGATLEKVSFRVEPADVGRYDHGMKGFYATKEGSCELIASAGNGKICSRVQITVKKEKSDGGSGFKKWIIIAAAIALLIFLLFRFLS